MKIKSFIEFIGEAISRHDIEVRTGLTDEEFQIGCEICSEILADELGIPKEHIYDDIHSSSSKELSSIAIDINTNEYIGSVICKESSLRDIVDSYEAPKVTYLSDLRINEEEKSIEGAALSVKKEFRNSFAVYKLLKATVDLGYQNFFIQQFESLEANIDYLRKGCKELIKIESPEYDESVIVYLYQKESR